MFLVGFILTLGRGFRLALSCMVSNPPKLTTLHYKVVRQIVGMGKLPRRGGMIVAWHEVPGTAELHDPSRRVRYEVFLAGDVQLQNRLLYRAIFLLQQPDHTVPYRWSEVIHRSGTKAGNEALERERA